MQLKWFISSTLNLWKISYAKKEGIYRRNSDLKYVCSVIIFDLSQTDLKKNSNRKILCCKRHIIYFKNKYLLN